MNILASNYPPLTTSYDIFSDKFNCLVKEADSLDIAVGFVSEKALDSLMRIVHRSGISACNFIIGMHYFDLFTRTQYSAALELNSFLEDSNIGNVRLVTSFPFHGKIYSFTKKDGNIDAIIGSSNLTNILKHKPVRQYEVDLHISDSLVSSQLKALVCDLSTKSLPINHPDLNINNFRDNSSLMTGITGVEIIEDKSYIRKIKEALNYDKSVDLPLKPTPKSNLNAYFGKGRENTKTGIVRRRPWYEVELIVPKPITSLPWYPKAGINQSESIIKVLTDDGYCFKCKISGDYSKNFRSYDDLCTLGRWIKGRLEKTGVLKMGELVTDDVLSKYGRNNIKMTPSTGNDIWYLDFSSERE